MTDLRHHCSQYRPLLAKATADGISVKCRDCKSVVVFPTSELLPILAGTTGRQPPPKAV